MAGQERDATPEKPTKGKRAAFAANASVQESPLQPRKVRKVLVIDDDNAGFENIERSLSLPSDGDVQYRLVHSSTLTEGLQRLTKEDIHVVLLDLQLSDSRGIATLRKVKQHPRQVPIIVLTAVNDEIMALRAVGNGAIDYLVKGRFDADALTRSIGYARARHKTQRQLAVALRKARTTEENLRNVVSSNLDGMIVVDEQGAVQFSNQAAQKLFGRTEKELQNLLPALPLSVDERTELEISHSSGAKIPIEVRCVGVDWEDEARHLLILHDLSHRKQAEVRQARLASIVNSTEDAVISLNLDGNLTSWNRGAEKIFGYPAEEALGQHISLLWPAELRSGGDAILDKIKRGESVNQFETVRVRKDGWPIEVSLSVSPITNVHGDVVSIAGIMRDMTERRQAENDRIERAKAEREINIARELQQNLFPTTAPHLDGFEIAGAVFPAAQASGDYFDFIPMRHNRLGVVVADVCGHGLAPAMMMLQTHAFLRALAQTQDDPGEILTVVNRLLPDCVDTQRFVSLFFGSLEPHERVFRFAAAGHRGYLLDHTGAETRLDPSGMVLGALKDQVLADASPIALHAGDLILLPTDGIQETRSPDGTLFGVPRALEAVDENRDKPAREIIDVLYRAACDWAQGRRLDDDMTVVVIKVEH